MTLVYIASGPPRVRLLNKITSLALPVFFYYIFMTVGVVVTGPGLVYIHTYIHNLVNILLFTCTLLRRPEYP